MKLLNRWRKSIGKRRAKNSTETPIARYLQDRFPICAPYVQRLKFVSKHRLFRSEPNGHIVFVIGGISAFCPLQKLCRTKCGLTGRNALPLINYVSNATPENS